MSGALTGAEPAHRLVDAEILARAKGGDVDLPHTTHIEIYT